MTVATVVRRHFDVGVRGREVYDGDGKEEKLFEGGLAEAIAFAKAIPFAERLEVTLETDDNFYGPDDFDYLTVDGVAPRPLELVHGSMIVRVTVAALNQLRTGLSPMASPMSIIAQHLDQVQAVIRGKQVAGLIVEEADGRRVLTIDAGDLADCQAPSAS